MILSDSLSVKSRQPHLHRFLKLTCAFVSGTSHYWMNAPIHVTRVTMKSKTTLLLLPALIALNLITTGRVTAHTFTTLHSFTPYPNYTNTDGANPNGFVLSGNVLYGTAANGGSSMAGTVFRVNTDGTGFTTLHNFTGGNDGIYPH